MIRDEPDPWIELIKLHKHWYPRMEGRDVYKLIYQGEMGPEHLIHSLEEFKQRLEAEFETLIGDEQERILEPVRPDRALQRINLRAYKSRGLPPDRLLAALLETGRTVTGDTNQVRIRWLSFVMVCERGRIPEFDVIEVHQFNAWLENLTFPVVHHSEVYSREYQPAYRLVSDRFLTTLGLDHAD